MKIKFNASADQIELIKLMGSKKKQESAEAVEAFAAVIGPIIQEVLLQAGTASALFTNESFGEDDNPSYPLDLHYGRTEGTVPVWSQTQAGGLASSILEGYTEMKISTLKLNSAVSLYKKYASKVRLNAIAKALEWLSQELLLKDNLNAWSVVTRALAEASTNSLAHTIRANTAGLFQVQDLNDLIQRSKRINSSFAGGTPSNFGREGLTNLIVSPEIKGDIRAFSYQPMNTRGVPNSDESTALGLPDAVREEIYRAGGTASIWGIEITDINELGATQAYNTLFDNYAGSTAYTTLAGGSSAVFNGATEELVLGYDASNDGLIRAVITDSGGGSVSVVPDDQFVTRQGKIGWFAEVEYGYVCVDSKKLLGLVV